MLGSANFRWLNQPKLFLKYLHVHYRSAGDSAHHISLETQVDGASTVSGLIITMPERERKHKMNCTLALKVGLPDKMQDDQLNLNSDK